jgi:hypothetical protein
MIRSIGARTSLPLGAILGLALLFSPAANAGFIHVGTGPGGTITDDGATSDALPNDDSLLQGGGLNSDIAVSGLTGTVTEVMLTINNMTHTWSSDWSVQLLHVDSGNFITLMHGPDTSDDTNGDITFADSGTQTAHDYLVTAGVTILDTRTYKPGVNALAPKTMAGTFGGLDPNSIWRLTVADRAGLDIGAFDDWDLYLDGVATQNGSGTPGGNGAIPEPSTFALMALGVAGLVAARRRNR